MATELHRQQREQYERNMLDIQRLQQENDHLEASFIQTMSDSHEMSWNILEAYLNSYLRTCSYIRTPRPVTVKDCKLRMDRRFWNMQEVVTWILVLPEERGVTKYWPKVDITNKHYLLQQHYDLGFVRYLAEKGLLEVEQLLKE